MQRTKQELIDLLNEKKNNSLNAYYNACVELNNPKLREAKEFDELKTSRDKNKAYMEAYIDVIALLESTDIVEPKDKGECVNKPNCEKSANIEDKKPKMVCLENNDCKRDNQFREFLDSLDEETFCVNAKQVESISKENRRVNKQYYVNIYLAKTLVVLRFDTKEEQSNAYNELKEWFEYWNK